VTDNGIRSDFGLKDDIRAMKRRCWWIVGTTAAKTLLLLFILPSWAPLNCSEVG
jgi:hypothetical protein